MHRSAAEGTTCGLRRAPPRALIGRPCSLARALAGRRALNDYHTARDAWLASAARFGGVFALLVWSLAVLPVAAKNRRSSVSRFLQLETAFTVVHYAIVSPLIALAWRAG